MAEGLAAVGVAASILQIIQIGCQIAHRINIYSSKCGDLPDIFKHVHNKIGIINGTLENFRKAIDPNALDEHPQKHILKALTACENEAQSLEALILTALPSVSDGNFKRAWKAVESVTYDEKVEKKMSNIESYINILHVDISVSSITEAKQSSKRHLPSPRAVQLGRRDPQFVNRSVLDDITRKSQTTGSRVALVGIGGIGKTQIATEFAHRVRDVSNDTWVFWVYAATPANVVESYSAIGSAIGKTFSSGSNLEMMQCVHKWLSDESNGKWVMIIDNADDLDVWTTVLQPNVTISASSDRSNTTSLPAHGPVRLHEFLPNSRSGTIIITSRYREVGRRLTGDYSQILQVDEMNELEAIALFEKRSTKIHDQTEVAALVKRLDYIPLAISHAASYIASRAGRVTVSQFLSEIEGTDQKTLQALEPSLKDSEMQWEKSISVVATLMISFQHIERTNPSAARLLALMSLFDRQKIPERLLVGHYSKDLTPVTHRKRWWKRYRRKSNQKIEIAAPDICNFDQDHQVLNDFAFVKTEQDGKHFKMHRLVQLITQRWLELQNSLSYWKTKYVELMYVSYPWPDRSTAGICEQLFTHALIARFYRPPETNLLENWGFLMHNAATYAYEVGFFKEAEDLHRNAISAWEIAFGKAHFNTLRLYNNLAQVLFEMKRHDEAIQMFQHVLTQRQQTLGESNQETALSAYCLGQVLYKIDRFDEAEAKFRQALKINEELSGIRGKETLHVVWSLASLLRHTGREAEHDELMIRAAPPGSLDPDSEP